MFNSQNHHVIPVKLLTLILFATHACLFSQIGVGAKAPTDAQILFDGSKESLDKNWTYWEGPRLAEKLPIKWEIVQDPLETGTAVNTNDPAAANGLYGAADIVTKEKFEDFRLHVEFLIENEEGNSGVYLQNRYEIQILDGDSTTHGMAAVINEKAASYKPYNGLKKWNAYDIVFRAARFDDSDNLLENPLVTIYFNGEKVHSNVSIKKVWGGPNSGLDGGNINGLGITNRPGGIKLQAEGHDVLFKNIWIRELDLKEHNTDIKI
jgi:hypothetical protein